VGRIVALAFRAAQGQYRVELVTAVALQIEGQVKSRDQGVFEFPESFGVTQLTNPFSAIHADRICSPLAVQVRGRSMAGT
jgi:hypothetical protein